jgi:hypothetical protein
MNKKYKDFIIYLQSLAIQSGNQKITNEIANYRILYDF